MLKNALSYIRIYQFGLNPIENNVNSIQITNKNNNNKNSLYMNTF